MSCGSALGISELSEGQLNASHGRLCGLGSDGQSWPSGRLGQEILGRFGRLGPCWENITGAHLVAEKASNISAKMISVGEIQVLDAQHPGGQPRVCLSDATSVVQLHGEGFTC